MARLAAAAAVVALASLASGCAVISGFGLLSQRDVVGDVETTVTICASGATPGCSNGVSGYGATDGTWQLLVGLRTRDDVTLPATLTSVSPAVTFTRSQSHTAELQRLSPAPPGRHWAGYISPTLTYSTTSGPKTVTPKVVLGLRRGADGSPFTGPVQTEILVGVRFVTPALPEARPVDCGPALAVGSADTLCQDGSGGFGIGTRDLGVLAAPAETAAQGGLASLAFPVRFAGVATPQANFSFTASSTLPGALFAVTPDSYLPPTDGSTQARVAVGVPAGARPGTYDVTLTARLGNGQARSATAKLTVRQAPAAAAGGATGAAARLRLRTVLPHRLSARLARRRGIAVLIGATERVTARVRLFQGRPRTPKASKRVRLKVPGPVKVVLRSAAFRTGRYRVVVLADGRRFVRRGALTR
jgi:hypothetical protein